MHKLLSSMLLVPLAFAGEPRLAKDLNAQLGKTADQITLQPVFGAENLTGHRLPGPVQPSLCVRRDGRLMPRYAGFHACVVKIYSVPRFNPGFAPWTESRTIATATGGPRVVPTVGNTVGPYPVDAPVITQNDPIRIDAQTTTIEHPGYLGEAFFSDLEVYFFFEDGSDTAIGWQAWSRINTRFGRSEWEYMGGRELDPDARGRLQLYRIGSDKKELKREDGKWWYLK